ncbi:sulfite exporter TauE/SafE family protein [Haloarcula amylolytica]|uniref:sulfite exporter TauE/SafE family protein n=1 Tax=Haloarcula amylolytica TaxID=396317 RepID=UPI003C70A5DC
MGSFDYTLDYTERTASEAPSIDTDDDGSAEASTTEVLNDGQTHTETVPDLAVGSTGTVSTTAGAVDVSVTATERTQTVDPAVTVNGNTESHSGTLADGSTTALTTDTAWLQSGTNTVDIAVGDGSLSADAPTPQVGLDYSHDAADRITTNYTAEQWSERYNVSHQYSSDRSDAQLRIPFSKGVYDVTNVEMRVNGGTWTAVSSSDYTLEPRNLTVKIGSVTAGDAIEIRTTARKVKVANGDITVSEPSEPGQTLDSHIQINSWSDSAYIEVPEHKNWQQVHYTYNESWNAESYAIVDDTGYQRVHMPNAVGGDQARVSTIPLEVLPSNGDVQLEVVDASTTEPQVRVSAGEKIDDPVDYTLIDAKDDTDYILWSVTHETVKDSGTANSPLTLSDDDSDEVLEFRIDDSGGDGGGGGGGGFWADSQQTVQQVQPALSPMAISGIFIGLLILAVGYTEWRKRRFSQPVYRRPIVWVAIGVGGFLSILLLNPMAITEPIQTALSTTLPLAGVLGVIGVAAWLYMRQKRKSTEASTPDTVVEIAGQVSSNDSSNESSDDGGGGWL